MNIKQLFEGKKEQIESLSKWTPIRMYMPLSAEELADAVIHGIDLTNSKKIVTPSYKQAAQMSDTVVPLQLTGEHLEVPEEFSTPLNVQRAHKMYPRSQDPLVTMMMLSAKPTVYFTGSVTTDEMNNIFITGYDQDGKRINPGSDRIEITPTRYLKWFINKIMIPQKRDRLKK